MAKARSTGDDVRIVLGSGVTTLKVGDFFLSGKKLYFVKNLLRNEVPVFQDKPSAQGDVVLGQRRGEYEDAPKTSGQAWVEGEDLFWDPATGKFTNVAGSLIRVAEVSVAAASGATVGVVILKE